MEDFCTAAYTAPDDAVWRETGDARLTLVITGPGLAAIGVDPAETPDDAAAGSNRKHSKQTMLIELLNRPDGATIAELTQALGWQAHSVRGAISGALKKKLGFTVMSEANAARGRVYRIAAEG